MLHIDRLEQDARLAIEYCENVKKDPVALLTASVALKELEKSHFEIAHSLNKEIRRVSAVCVKNADSIEEMQAFDEACKRAMVFDAPYETDAFMQAMEWDREPQARFWVQRRNVLHNIHNIDTIIDDFLSDQESLFLGLSLPPGAGKSTIIKFILTRIAGRYPMDASMYLSYADGMVKMMYDSVTSLMMEDEYNYDEIFPTLSKPVCSGEYFTVSYKSKGDFPTIGMGSLGGSITGRTRANRLFVIDDLVKNREVANSPTRLAKLYDDYNLTLTSRMIGDDVKQIMLGTIWSAHDPLSRKRSEYKDDPRYKFINIPIWKRNANGEYESNFDYDHKDGYSVKKIFEIKKALDPVDFSCLYMQQPKEKAGIAFPEESLNYYGGILPDGDPDNILFFADVAWGGGDSFSCPIGYVYGTDCYIHDVLFSKADKTVTQPRLIGKIFKHKIKMGRFEANNGGAEYCDAISLQLKEKYNYSMNLSHKKAPNNASKLSRIEQYIPDIKEFYFLDDIQPPPNGSKSERVYRDDDYTEFMIELTGFSLSSINAHDDAPDSMAGLAAYLNRNNKSISIYTMPSGLRR